jgi:hypothetical protein
MAKQTDNDRLRDILLGISDDIEGGSDLSNAMSHYPNVFSSLYVNMVRAGEASGQLEATLNRVAALQEYELHALSQTGNWRSDCCFFCGGYLCYYLCQNIQTVWVRTSLAYTGNDRYGCVSQAILAGEFAGDGPLGGCYPLVGKNTAGSLLARLAQSTHPHVWAAHVQICSFPFQQDILLS